MTNQIVMRGGNADLEPTKKSITIVNKQNEIDAQVKVTYSDEQNIPTKVTVNVDVEAKKEEEYKAPDDNVVINVELPEMYDGVNNPERIMFRY